MFLADKWKEYEVLDTSGGEKLERWGDYKLVRPDPQVIWQSEKRLSGWRKPNAHYHRSSSGGGEWEFFSLPDEWDLHYDPLQLTFRLKPFKFKHTGLFPEQAANWEWFSKLIAARKACMDRLSAARFDIIKDNVKHVYDYVKYYDFPDISLYLPVSWEGRFTVETDDYGVAFYQTASYEKYLEEGLEGGGFLFRLGASEDESFRDLLAYQYLGYSENASMHFYLTLPPEYTAYPETDVMEDYEDMAGSMETIIKMVRIAPSLSFYTDGLESTDTGMS